MKFRPLLFQGIMKSLEKDFFFFRENSARIEKQGITLDTSDHWWLLTP